MMLACHIAMVKKYIFKSDTDKSRLNKSQQILISLSLYSVKKSIIKMVYTTLNNILLPSRDSLPQNVISRSSIEGLPLAKGLPPKKRLA